MKLIVGSTGLVGTSLIEQENFDFKFNSKNIHEFNQIATDGDELLLTCLPATKWMVNKDVVGDMKNINDIINIISRKKYSKVTLISTIDVYNQTHIVKVNEYYSPNVKELSYGTNRLIFEMLVKTHVSTDSLKIFRLPALFNKHIKKNVLFDLINDNNVDQINSNSSFQWYNLDNLSNDIKKYSKLYPNETLFNLFTEPVDTMDIVSLFPHHMDKVKFLDNRVVYDYETRFGKYISIKEEILNEIKKFINEFSTK
jgi:hypothetical protein